MNGAGGEGDLEWVIPPCWDKGRAYDETKIAAIIIYVDHKPTAYKLANFLHTIDQFLKTVEILAHSLEVKGL